jgi:hypothetical protein
MGGRGSVGWMYETIISLVLIGLFTVTTMGFIEYNATGEIFFSRFYANDLSSTADLVAASYGDIVVRYDNIKPSLDLSFQNTPGKIRVYTGKDIGTSAYYGKMSYEGAFLLERPGYLVLRNIAGRMSMQDAQITTSKCGSSKLLPEEVIITLKGPEQIVNSFRQTLDGTVFKFQDNGNIILNVERTQGVQNKIIFSASNDDGKSYACHILERFSISGLQFSGNEPGTESRFALSMVITISSEEVLTDEQIGRTLALALVRQFS